MDSDTLRSPEEMISTLHILENENLMLSEKAEDTQLIRQILETIVLTDDVPSLLEAVLEQISILKSIPYCSYCRLQGVDVQQISVYAAYSNRDFSSHRLRLPNNLTVGPEDRFYQIDGSEFLKLNPFLHTEGDSFVPSIAALFSFVGETVPAGFFVFIDDDPDADRFAAMSDLLQNIIHIVVERIDKINMAADLQDLNRELADTQKMSYLGQLISGVAHEVNTPLGNSITAMTLLRDEIRRIDTCEARTRFLGIADLVVENLLKSSELIEKFKKLTIDNLDSRTSRIDLMEFLKGTVIPRIRYIDNTLKNEILIEGPDRCMMQTHPDAIIQILTNLVFNAWIHGYHNYQEDPITIRVVADDSIVTIQVSDQGSGMDQTVQSRMYDPFFVADRTTGGSGLGMAIVYNTTYGKLNGCLRCVSAPGEGTEISVIIPVDINVPESEFSGHCGE